MNDRVQWIDVSKGIGIFLVIIGHTMIQGELRGQIYAFHMPLFFFISGYLFSNRRYPQIKQFVLAKARTILIPYISFSIISIVLMKIFQGGVIDFSSLIRSFLLSERNGIYFNQPLWFLTSLFTIEVIFYLLIKYIKKQFYMMLLVTAMSCFSVSVLDAVAGTKILPWSFDQSLYFLFYFAMGYRMKLTASRRANGTIKKSPLFMVSAVLYLLFLMDGKIYAKIFQIAIGETWHLHDYLFLYLNNIVWAMIAIHFIIYVSQFLSLSFLQYLGKNSLILLALHVSLGFNIINRFGASSLQAIFHQPNLLGLIYTILTIILLIPVITLINKYFPCILGRKKERKTDKTSNTKNNG
ncbi:acyltransferase family protein [Bacillus tuaregi]|uniref:acyltransferase family protein n=1 Tax=Bacillus tuaregi TaxID=1816695 RepID=UPI0013566852|nr:acyltransferase family protein [Bacillus tuaregi]